MHPLQPILTTDLFPELHNSLMALLRELSPEEWQRPTACGSWNVRDVVVHLLGDDIGKLSAARDGYHAGWFAVNSWQELVTAINTANEQWVRALTRISPQLLCEFLALTGPQVAAYFTTLDPDAIGGPVDWAGPAPAPVWLDLAREYTERWHHQQHIRDAVGRPGMKEPRYLTPVLDTFLRALPHTFRTAEAAPATLLKLQITGEAGGEWYLYRHANGWQLYADVAQEATTIVTMDQDHAWRLFTRGIDGAAARAALHITGNEALGLHLLQAVSIIA
ncbi:MAG: maleylpyruvate isomerase family mycothiol-dependent enzyme [Caldilineaceae bacterium]|nr:maleylpyruvate isomerase family mycothiol-dependent enzyme [Caldilineaceae bacterium]